MILQKEICLKNHVNSFLGILSSNYYLLLDVRDLGLELEKMASSMLIMSHTIEDLGNQLKRDESLTDDPTKYQRARRNIQNNMGKDFKNNNKSILKFTS